MVSKRREQYLMIGITIEAAIIVILVVLLKLASAGDWPLQRVAGDVPRLSLTPRPATPGPPTSSALARLKSEPYAFKGSTGAPLTITEFSDFQCPWCGRFFSEVLPNLEETYIRTGKVFFVYKDFTVLGPESDAAAWAAECAGQQGEYWGMHDRLFASASQWAHQGVGKATEVFKGFAGELGLDAERFATCLTSEEIRAEVRGDFAEARSIGARGTPTFIIGQRVVPGFLPWEEFRQIVEQALAGK